MLNSNRNIKYVSYLFLKKCWCSKSQFTKVTQRAHFLIWPSWIWAMQIFVVSFAEVLRYLRKHHSTMTGNFISGPQKQWKLKLSIVDFHKQGHRDLNIRSVNVLISGKVCFKAFFFFLVFLILTSDRRYLVLLILVNYTLDSFHFTLYSRHLSNKLACTHEENHVMKK